MASITKTLAQKDDLCASTFKCNECDFFTKTSRGLKMNVSKQHMISQLDGEYEVTGNDISDKSDKYEDPFILGIQYNGFSKLEMISLDEMPPEKFCIRDTLNLLTDADHRTNN